MSCKVRWFIHGIELHEKKGFRARPRRSCRCRARQLKLRSGCHLTTRSIVTMLEAIDGTYLASKERYRGSNHVRREGGLARGGRRQLCLGADLLSIQRRGMSLRRVLHHQRVEYAEEPWQPARALRRVVDNCTTHRKQHEADDDAEE